ncbi:MAG: amidase family protein [Pigmentiphaga sp.]|uniref:amidase n=1 Tax=Pigmentiphaga sp. TaxID=1977564 RepID=UPI0029B57E2C|nr:amidase family protein [Pigmentiphaga sp.]MDX3906052.1 amidase family protein [Pigmentiphaga sp.]
MPAPAHAWLSKSAVELHEAYRSRTLSPLELATALLEALDDDARELNAFCLIDREAAMRAAEASARRWRSGSPIGPLDGIPVSIKDMVDVAGWPTRRGSRLTAGAGPAAADAPSVALLRQAGAVLFGKTTTSEFGWLADSDSAHTGVTHNPAAPGRSAGGSSMGAAAHVARGWGPLAVGSDAGGSVRIPASYCGLVGIKPSFGAIPSGPKLSAFADFAHLGPIARSVADCRLALQVMGRPHPLDPHSLYSRAQELPPRRPAIAYMTGVGADTALDPAVEAAVEALAERLARKGHTVTRLHMDWMALAEDSWALWLNRLYESFVDATPAQRAELDPRLQQACEDGGALSNERLARARVRLRDAATEIAVAFADIDLLLTPASPAGPPAVGAFCADDHPLRDRIRQACNWHLANPYTFPFNLTQQPALCMPLTADTHGLPVGLQIVGRKYRDDDVLDFAQMLESTRFIQESDHA